MPLKRKSKGVTQMSYEGTNAIATVIMIAAAGIGSYVMSAKQDEETRVLVGVMRTELDHVRTHEARIVRLETTDVATEERLRKVEGTMDSISFELGRLNGTLSRIEGKLEIVLP